MKQILSTILIILFIGGFATASTRLIQTNQLSSDVVINSDIDTLAKLNALVAETIASTTHVWDISDYTNLTAGDALTLTDDDIDFDGGATPGGELGGTWASPTVDSGIHDDEYIKISDYNGTTTKPVNLEYSKSFWVASTTIDHAYNSYDTATATWALFNSEVAITITDIYCKTDTGTSTLECGDGTNWSEPIACDSDGQEDDGSIANGTFTAREDLQCRIGTQAASNKTTVTINYK